MDQTERRNEMLLHLCAAYLLTQGYSPTGPQQDAEALRARWHAIIRQLKSDCLTDGALDRLYLTLRANDRTTDGKTGVIRVSPE